VVAEAPDEMPTTEAVYQLRGEAVSSAAPLSGASITSRSCSPDRSTQTRDASGAISSGISVLGT